MPQHQGTSDQLEQYRAEARVPWHAAGIRTTSLPSRGMQPIAWAWLGVVLLAAFGLRIGLAVLLPNVHHADEVFQALEPAHRLWFDWGVVSWEWRDGVRSWLFPGLLAGVMGLTDGLTGGPHDYLASIAVVLSILSLGVVVVGFLLGHRLFGLPGAVITSGLCAIWYDLIYIAPKTLSEAPAAHILVIALYLLGTPGETDSSRRYWAAGVLLGLTFCFRFHTAPAILFAAVYACRWHVRERWLPVIIGGLIPVLAVGVLDALTWGLPFQSIWKNLWINIVEGRSRDYGASPPLWYFVWMIEAWGGAVAPMAALFVVGARRAPLLAGAAVVHVLAHMPIAHKEFRFLYPVMPLIVILIGLGTAEIASKVSSMLAGGRSRLRAVVGGALAAWAVTSTALAVSPDYRGNWSRFTELIRATERAGAAPDLCGLGLVGIPWWATGGYTRLHRAVPMYYLPEPESLDDAMSAFNHLLIPKPLEPAATGFAEVQCWAASPPNEYGDPLNPPVCLMRRTGGCIADARYELNTVLTARDE
ncbi:MAG TPA: hypothetical protein VHG35_02245 [Gemmatimonadales bacterium]|nr:hypothetical protein [Gemmatimonadales bacterium]